MSKNTWTTKSGEVLNIKDMTTSHISNCLKMMARMGNAKIREKEQMLCFFGANPDTEAARLIDDESEKLAGYLPQDIAYEVFPEYQTMFEELANRIGDKAAEKVVDEW